MLILNLTPTYFAASTMTLSIRFIPNSGQKVIYAGSGRVYLITGATIDIPFPDADTIQPDQATRLMIIGTTADRPINVPGRINWPPRQMYDTTISRQILLVPGSNPARWVDITGSTV